MCKTAEDLVMRVINSPDLLARAKSKDGVTLKYGSWYSGYNSLGPALHYWSERLKAVANITISFKCVYCVEKCSKCHQLIQLMHRDHRPSHIFIDAEHMLSEDGKAFCCMVDRRVAIPSVDFLVAGPECGTVSRLNNTMKRSRDCIKKEEGRTGVTFSFLWKFCKKHHASLWFIVFENVETIDGRCGQESNPLEDACELFKQAGFIMAAKAKLHAMNFRACQNRLRFYAVFLNDTVTMSTSTWDFAVQET